MSMPRRTQNARVMVVRRLPKEAKDRHAMTHGSGGERIEAPSSAVPGYDSLDRYANAVGKQRKNLYSWLSIIT